MEKLAEEIIKNEDYKWLKKKIGKRCKYLNEPNHEYQHCPFVHNRKDQFKRYCIFGVFCKFQSTCNLNHFSDVDESIEYIKNLYKYLIENKNLIKKQKEYLDSLLLDKRNNTNAKKLALDCCKDLI